MSTVGVTVSLTQVKKSDAFNVAGTAVLAAGVKDLDQANALAGMVNAIAHSVQGGSHVSGSVYLTVSPTSLSGSISLSACTPDVQPQPVTATGEAAPSSSEPVGTGG